jgi:hypothetical protein
MPEHDCSSLNGEDFRKIVLPGHGYRRKFAAFWRHASNGIGRIGDAKSSRLA